MNSNRGVIHDHVGARDFTNMNASSKEPKKIRAMFESDPSLQVSTSLVHTLRPDPFPSLPTSL